MIKFNCVFSFERDTYGWKLHETKVGKDKNGNQKDQVHTTYHADLKQVSYTIVDRSAGNCESLEGLLSLLRDARVGTLKRLEGAVSEQLNGDWEGKSDSRD